MTEMEECIHGLGPVEACVICNGRAQREAKEAAEQPRIFPTKFYGHCPECNLPIHVGEMIAWFPEGSKPVVHEGCLS